MHRDTLENAQQGLTRKRRNCRIKSLFFAHKKYSRSFIKLRLSHWCHMDYFNDVFLTFLGLEHGSCVAVYAGSESSRIFIFVWTIPFKAWNLLFLLPLMKTCCTPYSGSLSIKQNFNQLPVTYCLYSTRYKMPPMNQNHRMLIQHHKTQHHCSYNTTKWEGSATVEDWDAVNKSIRGPAWRMVS